MSDQSTNSDQEAAVEPAAEALNGHEPIGNGKVVTAEVAPKSRMKRGPRPVAAAVEVPQGELPTQIDESDKAYHRMVAQDYQAAQAAMQSWMRYCVMKYRLGPGSRVDEAGNIIREPMPQMAGQPPAEG